MDTVLRRRSVSRFDTRRDTGRFALTEKRLNRLYAFYKHGFLSTSMLAALADPSIAHDTVSEQLKMLKRHGYIEQDHERLKEADDPLHSDLIFRIAPRGVDELELNEWITADDAILWRKLRSRYKQNDYWHDVACSLATASVELGARALGVEYTDVHQSLRSAPRETLNQRNPLEIPFGKGRFVPDALFGLRDRTQSVYFAVEMDMGTEQERFALKRSTLGGKYRAYRHMWAADGNPFNLPPLRLLLVTVKPSRVRAWRELFLEEMQNDAKLSGTGPVFMRAEPSLNRKRYAPFSCNGAMLLTEWERVAREPTVIFKKKTAA